MTDEELTEAELADVDYWPFGETNADRKLLRRMVAEIRRLQKEVTDGEDLRELTWHQGVEHGNRIAVGMEKLDEYLEPKLSVIRRAVAEEREACAKIAEDDAIYSDCPCSRYERIAQAIRARGGK